MKKETLQVKYDAEKLSALRLYMKKSQADLDGELGKSIDKLYEKHVPKDVRELFEMQRQEQTDKPQRPPRPRPPADRNPGNAGTQQE
jgi:hypothetical protein